MPITYNIDTETGVVLVRWQGGVSLQDLAHHWDRLLKDDAFPKVSRAITDLRDSTFEFTSFEFWKTMDNHYREAIALKDFRVALLVGNEDQGKYAKIWMTLIPKSVRASIFYDSNQATKWLFDDQSFESDT